MQIKNLLLPFLMNKQSNDSFMTKLVKSNTGVSSKNFFLVVTTILGTVLLFMIILAIVIDLIFNHTVTMSWGDMATYIGAVAGLFASAGITKAWSDSSYNKYVANDNNGNGIPDDEEDLDDTMPEE